MYIYVSFASFSLRTILRAFVKYLFYGIKIKIDIIIYNK